MTTSFRAPRDCFVALLLAMTVMCFSAAAGAQQASTRPGGYPTKPVRVLVGNAPGGGIDITARAVSQKLSEAWGRSVVVDNRPGASGLIAMELTAQAPADGYTMLVTAGSLIASAQAQKKLRYDVRTAFAPAGTPPPLVSAIHRDVVQVLKSPDVQAMFANDGAEAAPSGSPAEFRATLVREVVKWEEIVKIPSFAAALR